MLVADVEAQGVWRIEGGMRCLAQALENCARKLGVAFHFGCSAERIEMQNANLHAVIDSNGLQHRCSAVVVNADSAAVAEGLFGDAVRGATRGAAQTDRSLSAVTWCAEAESRGVALEHHSVFFSDDYEAEFADLAHGPAQDPTVYICDQNNGRKLILVNAPANADAAPPDIDQRLLRRLSKSGLHLNLNTQNMLRRSPKEFAELYPATSGALYGRSSHGWMSTFLRPQAQTKIPGLYLAGGSTHPGPGVPMAALSGMRAAEALLHDRALTQPFRKMAIAGGTLMR
jgi:1-hydroxycarotenoid 3,4-desaturase